jgi:ADP-ribose pyrophosphatase
MGVVGALRAPTTPIYLLLTTVIPKYPAYFPFLLLSLMLQWISSGEAMEHQILKSDTIYEGRAFDVQRVHVHLPDGRNAIYDLVKHPGAVTLVPVDDAGNIWFVRQYRVGVGASLLELPAGTLEPGEDPEPAAAREIREEIGMAATKLQLLGEFYMAPGYSSEHMWVYLATGLRADPLPGDDDEFLKTEAIPVAEALQMARTGKIMDGKSLASLIMAEPFI